MPTNEHNIGSLPDSRNVAVVIPCYKVKKHILGVIAQIPDEVDLIIIVDDFCPDQSGKFVESECTDPRVSVKFLPENLGVGGATMAGMSDAIIEGTSYIVKIDGDGQMDPSLIPAFVAPLKSGIADYVKGNRFSNPQSFDQMPFVRKVGNLGLGFLGRFSSGYYDISDPTNGYFAIHASVASALPFEKISPRYFFETDILFRLGILRALVVEIPHYSFYGNEESHLSPLSEFMRFSNGHLKNFIKRIVYQYFLHDFSMASIFLAAGLLALMTGLIGAVSVWIESNATGIATSGGALASLQIWIFFGSILLLSFLNSDMHKPHRRAIQHDLAILPKRPFVQFARSDAE